MLPIVIAVSDNKTKTQINTAINTSVQKIIQQMDVTSNDFIKREVNDSEKNKSISINTVLINEICGKVGEDISQQLSTMEPQKVSVPIGALTGIDAISNTGPKYGISILHRGNAVVNYESAFESVGINQINFQIWLNIETHVQLVNPLKQEEITVSRRLPLVNTIISGEVPSTYLNSKDGTIIKSVN